MDLYEIETPENKAVRRFAWKLEDAETEAGYLLTRGLSVRITQRGQLVKEYIGEQQFMTEHQCDNMS